jgi:hypothetical protein
MSFLLGIGVGAEYPCGSVAASEQSEEEGIAKNAQHRWFALATSTRKQPLGTALLTIYLRHFARYDDRLWVRGVVVCAPGSVLDVGLLPISFGGPRLLISTFRSSQIWQ